MANCKYMNFKCIVATSMGFRDLCMCMWFRVVGSLALDTLLWTQLLNLHWHRIFPRKQNVVPGHCRAVQIMFSRTPNSSILAVVLVVYGKMQNAAHKKHYFCRMAVKYMYQISENIQYWFPTQDLHSWRFELIATAQHASGSRSSKL